MIAKMMALNEERPPTETALVFIVFRLSDSDEPKP